MHSAQVFAGIVSAVVLVGCAERADVSAPKVDPSIEPEQCYESSNSIGFHPGDVVPTALAAELAVEIAEDRDIHCPGGKVHVTTYRGEGDVITTARHAAILAILDEAGVNADEIIDVVADAPDEAAEGRTIVTLRRD